jgi:transcription antitermination factor NusG
LTTSQPSLTSDSISAYLNPASREEEWFAVQTRPRFEKKVCQELEGKGIQAFVPLHDVKRQWSDRKQLVSLPLFPCYAFVRIDGAQDVRVAVLRTNGITGFVGARGFGTPIPESEIDAVKTILKQQVPFQLHPYLKVGQSVRIRGGALDGIKGILTKVNGDQSLVISVDLIQRSVAMQVTGYEIEPA